MPNGDDHRQRTLVEMAQSAERRISELERKNKDLGKILKTCQDEKASLLETIRLLKNDNS